MSGTGLMDQSTDLGGQATYRIHELYGMPAYVKSASAEDRVGGGTLLLGHYGDPVRRLYPLHTKAATWLSAAFYYERAERGGSDLSVAGRIMKAADYHEIRDEVTALRAEVKKAFATGEAELTEADYGLVVDAAGTKERRYPLRNATEVKAAARLIGDRRTEFTFEERTAFAEKVLQKAAVFGADLSPYGDTLLRVAGQGICAAKHAAEACRERISEKQPPQFRNVLEKLAAAFDENPEMVRDHAVMMKTAATLDTIDRACGLSDTLSPPEDVLFAVTEKVASDYAARLTPSTATGRVYEKEALEKLPLAALDHVRPGLSDLADRGGVRVDGEKLAALVGELSRDESVRFESVAAEYGVAPSHQKAGTDTRGERTEALRKAAAAHTPRPGSFWDRYSRARG